MRVHVVNSHLLMLASSNPHAHRLTRSLLPVGHVGPKPLLRFESLSLCNAGTYSYPRSPKVTAECRDLLDKIFVVTPKERITLLGIQVSSQCLHLCSVNVRTV